MSNVSEWSVQTVKVFHIEPHPNADRLELITIGLDIPWGYTVVSQRGSHTIGQLVTFVSPGSLVPLSDSRWSFLKSRAGGGDGFYRIRAMSLRGVKSQGILTDWVPGSKLGDDVSSVLGIMKYYTHEEKKLELEYRPVEISFFGRLLKSLLGNRFQSKTRKLANNIPVYSVINLKKVNPFKDDETVTITEKIHGTNVRFGKLGGKLVVGSHRRIVSDTRNWFEVITGRRGATIETMYEKVVKQLINVDELEEGIIYYGEIFGKTPNGKNVQDMTYGQDGPAIRLFLDCFDMNTGKWCSNIGRILGPFVPIIYNGNFNMDIVKSLSDKESCFGGLREGVVVYSANTGATAKYVSQAYLER